MPFDCGMSVEPETGSVLAGEAAMRLVVNGAFEAPPERHMVQLPFRAMDQIVVKQVNLQQLRGHFPDVEDAVMVSSMVTEVQSLVHWSMCSLVSIDGQNLAYSGAYLSIPRQ